MSSTSIARAVSVLRSGGLLAYPTEAVWGLGCDPARVESIQRLLALKQRSPDKGLIMVAASADQLAPWLNLLQPAQRQRVCAPTPRPTTWIVPDPAGYASAWVRGDHQGVAVRLSRHPVVAALCRGFGGPVISTSANPAGQAPALDQTTAWHYFGTAIDYYLPGDLGAATAPSIIRDVITGEVLRDSDR